MNRRSNLGIIILILALLTFPLEATPSALISRGEGATWRPVGETDLALWGREVLGLVFWSEQLFPIGRRRRRAKRSDNRVRRCRRRGQNRGQRRRRGLQRPVDVIPHSYLPLLGQRQIAPRAEAVPTAADPLADLRQGRGWIDYLDEETLWEVLRQVRWPQGVKCPKCGETDPLYLKVINRHHRGGMWRYRCRVCAEAGDPGEGGTFTDLSGTLFAGTRLDIRSLWLAIERFVEGQAGVESAKEAALHRHTTQRLFRLLRAAIYQGRSNEPIALTPSDIAEGDELYISAGVKGQAGGLKLERPPRKRGLKQRGRGSWESDRLPVFGLLCRQGQIRLFVLPNVQTQTIRPLVHQMVERGVKVYTDSYNIYNFLSRDGYQHHSVNHSSGEYARGEVHCNSIEATWSWLRQMIRTYRGVSKVYLPLYVAQFEFFYNRRHDNRWSQMLDLMQVAFQADAEPLLAKVDSAEFAEVCPMAC